MTFARDYFAAEPATERMECRATTRRGTPCQRTPLPHNGYCPSHQHLAETEDEQPSASLGGADAASDAE